MPKRYIVRECDYLDRIAFATGHTPDELWNLAENGGLKATRSDRNILKSGDVLHLPDPKPARPVSLSVGAENSFVASVPTVRVSVTVLDRDRKPLANKGYSAMVRGVRVKGTTDGDGMLSFEVPVIVEAVEVVVDDGGTLHLVIGDMDPIETDEGVAKRLTHLGYECGLPGEPEFASAVTAFRRDHGLNPNGAIDKEFRDALVAAHLS